MKLWCHAFLRGVELREAAGERAGGTRHFDMEWHQGNGGSHGKGTTTSDKLIDVWQPQWLWTAQ